MSTDDDILGALNGSKSDAGGMPPYAPGEIAPDAAPSRDAQLTINAAPPPTALKAADAQHSVAVGGHGYRVRVKGEYYASNPNGRGKIKKPYELSFNVPKLDGCQSVIKNKLLLMALRKKYPDAVRHRTFSVVDQKPLSPSSPKSNSLAYMDRGQLEGAILSLGAPIDVSGYPASDEGTLELRESIIDFVQNPDSQERDDKGQLLSPPGAPGTFIARENERQRKRAEDRELAELNPELTA